LQRRAKRIGTSRAACPTAILSLIELRLEQESDQAQNMVFLTEIFVDDMDGQLREFGIGDMIVGKHIGKIMAAFGGRMGAYRAAIDNIDNFEAALIRNLYRGENPGKQQCLHVGRSMIALKAALDAQNADTILRAELEW
jgi:cytochrome b pre-mRNA-processing protein 3